MAGSTYSEIQKVEEGAAKKKNKKHTSGAYTAIFLAAIVPCIVVLSISGLLIGLVFANRVILNSGLPELQTSSTPGNTSSTVLDFVKGGGSGAYFIQFNPSTLSIIASWTGKLIPYLSSGIMGLVAFFVADSIRKMSQEGQIDRLPTPRQIVVLLNTLLGGFDGLWTTLRYRATKGNKYKKPLAFAVTALFLTTLIGFVIIAVDTWFGVVVVPIERTQIQIASPPKHFFSRGLNNDCIENRPNLTCTLYEEIAMAFNPTMSDAGATLTNTSAINMIRQFPSSQQQPIFYLGDTAASSDIDFKASTYAVSTQCQPMTKQCLPPASGFKTSFNCSTGLAGNLSAYSTVDSAAGLGLQFFQDPGLITPWLGPPENQMPSGQNPLYFGTWAINQESQTLASGTGEKDDGLSDLVGQGSEAWSWFLNCSATVYDTTYTWVNGSLASHNTTLSNNTIGLVVLSIFYHTYGDQALQLAATTASFGNSSADVAATTAEYFSRSALSMAGGVFANRTNLLEQSRSTMLLTRVPLIPFYTLIVLKMLYALSAMLLAIATIIWAHPAQSAEVKAQLTIEGLVAAIFGSDSLKNKAPGDLQEVVDQDAAAKEDQEKKVAVVKTEGGRWTYATVVKLGAEVTVEPLQEVTRSTWI